MKKKYSVSEAAVCLCALLALLCFLLRAEAASSGFVKGMKLCITVVLPSLFPFMAVSSFILYSGLDRRLSGYLSLPLLPLKISGGGLCYLAALLSGNPLGAKCVCEQYLAGRLSKRDAQVLLCLCGNTGAAFVYGALGLSCFGSVGAAGLLLGVNYLSPYLSALLLSRSLPAEYASPKPAAAQSAPNYAKAFVEAVGSAARSCINIAAFIGFFSVLGELLQSFFPHSSSVSAVVLALLEISSGTRLLAALPIGSARALMLCAGAVGFGGICIFCQCLCFVADTDLSVRTFFLGKCGAGAIAMLLMGLSLRLLPISVPTMANPDASAAVDPLGAILLFLLFLLIIGLGIIKAKIKGRK